MRGRHVQIAAAPISDSKTTAIPLFNEYGGKTGGFRLPAEVSPPVLVVAGKFLPDQPGEQFALASRSRKSPLLIVSPEGTLLRTLGPLLPDDRENDLRIEAMPNAHGGHDLFASSGAHWQRLAFNGEKSLQLQAKTDRETTGVFPTAFDLNRLLIPTPDPIL